MNDKQYRADIDKVRQEFTRVAMQSNVGVVVPAAMEIVLNAVLALPPDEGRRAVASLRPMLDYMESQIEGVH